MFLFVLALALSQSAKSQPNDPAEPSAADIAVLERAVKDCHLHQGALMFVREAVPREPVIRMTRAYGDTDQQLECALRSLPADFNDRFGLEFEPAH